MKSSAKCVNKSLSVGFFLIPENVIKNMDLEAQNKWHLSFSLANCGHFSSRRRFEICYDYKLRERSRCHSLAAAQPAIAASASEMSAL